MLICPKCRHENEDERTYCHDCGAKLNRSRLKKEGAQRIQKRLRQVLVEWPDRFKRTTLRLSKVILGGFAAAALILLLSPPDLPESKMNSGLLPPITLELENATAAHQGARLRYTEQEVNAYLADALRSKQAALDKPLLRFERVVVKMDEGLCQITVERSLFGYPLYTTGVFEVSTANGDIIASNRGGSVGRMQIHPVIMKYGDVVFADLWQTLERERILVAKMAATKFHPQSVELTAALQ